MRVFDIPDDPDRDDQDAYARLAETAAKGVAIASARSGAWDVAATVTDHLSVSYDPPTLLVSLYALSRIADAVTSAGTFGLSVLSRDQRQTAERLSEPGAPLVGLLDHIRHFRAHDAGPALIAGSLAWFEAEIEAVHPAATHLLVIGRVVRMGSDAPVDTPPLLRFRSEYRL